MRKPIIAGNWKMNGSRSSIKELLEGVKAGMGDVTSAEVAVCAPSIYLADVSDQLSGSALMPEMQEDGTWKRIPLYGGGGFSINRE